MADFLINCRNVLEDRKEGKMQHKHGRLFFLSTVEMFQWTFISPEEKEIWLAYHQIIPLVEVNQAKYAWSFRQGNNLPILHPSPKYRTQPLISIGIERKQKCNIHKHGRLFFHQLQKCFSGLSLVLKKRRFQLAYHQILPLVEVNQAIDAWSFRQGNNLPISQYSPKYRT